MKNILWILLLALPAKADAAATGAAFLRIDTGARPAAMGGAYTAVADDVNALYYNPGGLPNIAKREFGATHTQWLLGSKFDFIGYAQPTKAGTFGLGLTRLTHGGFVGRDENRQAVSGFEASDMAYTVGYGRALKDLVPGGRTNLGVNVKFLQSKIGADSASTMALDLGAVHQMSGRPLSLGFSVLNIGRGMRFLDQTDPLPLTFSGGAAYRFAGVLSLALDVRHEAVEKRTDVGVGTEYGLFSGFFLRAGYSRAAGAQSSPAGEGASTLSGLGGGFGIRMARYRLDYTFTPFGALGNAQRISLGARF